MPSPTSASAARIDPEHLLAQGWRSVQLPGHMGHIGPVWIRDLPDGRRTHALLAQAQHLNPAGVVHGGVLLTLADHAMSTAAWEAAGRSVCMTVQMDAQFLAPVQQGQLVWADTTLRRESKHLVFVSTELKVSAPDGKHTVALSGQGIMKVWRDQPLTPAVAVTAAARPCQGQDAHDPDASKQNTSG